MVTYHFNFGYPFLDESLTLEFPAGTETTPVNDWSRAGMADCRMFKKPADSEPEYVYFHRIPSADGWSHVIARQEKLRVQADLRASADTLPILVEWKSMRSGDYALGLEPSNNLVMGRSRERENGTLKSLPPFGSAEMTVRLSFSDL
jgi:hypothetical protein